LPRIGTVERDTPEVAAADNAVSNAASNNDEIARFHIISTELADIFATARKIELELLVTIASMEGELLAIRVVAFDEKAIISHRQRPLAFSAGDFAEDIEQANLLDLTPSGHYADKPLASPLNQCFIPGTIIPRVHAFEHVRIFLDRRWHRPINTANPTNVIAGFANMLFWGKERLDLIAKVYDQS